MFKIIEYSELSKDTYHPGRKYKSATLTMYNKGSLENNTYLMIDPKVYLSPTSHFYAALYINFKDGEAKDAVIAFRGTVATDINNVLADIYSWYSDAVGSDFHDHIPWYFDQARCFVINAKRYLSENFPNLNLLKDLSYTGHSLGGALAQLMTLMHHPVPCCVFNSPVCRHIVPEQSHEYWPLVNNINARYGIINKVGGLPLGNLSVIDNPVDEAEAKILCEKFDTKEYLTGKVLSKLGDSTDNVLLEAEGTKLQLSSLVKTGFELKNSPQHKLNIKVCEDEYEYLFLSSRIGEVIGEIRCNEHELKRALFSVPGIIMAQHSIDNMVKALQATILAGVRMAA